MAEHGLRNRWLRAGIDHIAHKLLEETFGITLIIFAALVLAKQLSILDFANVVLTDVVQVVDAATTRALSAPANFADVQTVLIGDRAYETEFGHQSPLPRPALADLVARTAAAAPGASLLIDLDVSPRGAATPRQEQLDDALVAVGPRVILVTPDAVDSPVAAAEKVAWIKRMCAARVRFGTPDLTKKYGSIESRIHDTGSIAHVAVAAPGPGAPCEIVKGLNDDTAPLFWSALAASHAPSGKHAEAVPLRQDFVDQGKTHTLNAITEVTQMAALKPAKFVVLGGGWGQDDIHQTPTGPRFGAALHAASVYSLKHPIHDVYAVIEILLDVFLLKKLFEPLATKLLRAYFAASRRHAARVGVARDGAPGGQDFLLAAAALLGFIVLLLTFCAGVLAADSLVRHVFARSLGAATLISGTFVWLFFQLPIIAHAPDTPQEPAHAEPLRVLTARLRHLVTAPVTALRRGPATADAPRTLALRLADFSGSLLHLTFITALFVTTVHEPIVWSFEATVDLFSGWVALIF